MTTTNLKLLAMFSMLIDHIAVFIPNMPIQFRWIGRISAPIFLFCTIEGYKYTSNKKIYLFKLYILNVLMGFLQSYSHFLFSFNEYNYTYNIPCNFIQTLLIVCIFIKIIESKNTYYYFFIFILYQIISSLIGNIIFPLELGKAIICSISYLEGGIIFIFLGLLFYLTRNNKKKLILYYLVFCILYFLITQFQILPRIILKLDIYKLSVIKDILFEITTELIGLTPSYINNISAFYDNYQWMMIFAIIFIYFYNNKRGINLKYLFYIFYPLHMIILMCIGNWIFNKYI